MADIWSEMADGGDQDGDPPCDNNSRTARRRRMEVRRFKFIAGDGVPAPGDVGLKRQRYESATREGGDDSSDSSSDLERGPPRPVNTRPARGSDRCPRFGVTSVCGRRRDMEDAISIHPSLIQGSPQLDGKHHFFAVFDGHGCSHAAATCTLRMHQIMKEEIEAMGGESWEWKDIMDRSFARVDAEAIAWPTKAENADCRCELRSPKCDHVGSTAVVAVVSSGRIIIANCGDSRAVLCRGGAALPLSCDHKPDRPDELNRIEQLGGRVIYWGGARVLGVLAMSRAIGDCYLKPFVVSEPELTVTDRSDSDECLILASDGLWDVVNNEVACDVATMCLRGNEPDRRGSRRACAEATILLTKLALARHSADNISVLVVDLRRGIR